MFTLVVSDYGLLALGILPKAWPMNSDYLCNVVLQEARRAMPVTAEKNAIEETTIHMDNCKGHNSRSATRKLRKFQVTGLSHPIYSPGISPCDFWFFGWSKDTICGQVIRNTYSGTKSLNTMTN
jgi:hypothetical protein